MKTRTKNALIFGGGVLTGFILFVVIGLMAYRVNTGGSVLSDSGLTLYENPIPRPNITGNFEVFQVLPNGNALANNSDNYGLVVLLLADKNMSYYDDQTVEKPQGYKVFQTGTYRYETKSESVKTVPVITFKK